MRYTTTYLARCLSAAVLLMAVAMLSPMARANSGVLLPLDQYQAGTEHVQNTIVTNGGFENVTAGNPNGWTLGGSFQDAAPVGPNTSTAVNGTHAAQGPLQGTQQRNGYTQGVTLAPNTDYVLSGYAWNFSDQTNGNFDLALVELKDANGHVKNFSLAPHDGTPPIDGARGVFGYKSFNSSFFDSPVTLQVAFEYDANFPFPHGPNVLGQLDNIAITPQAQFVPPNQVPEPATLSLVALAGGAALVRRQRRA